MVRLSININKVATLRNARGKDNPSVLQTALDLIALGADGITVHPRPDERHIRKSDVYELALKLNVEFNIEGYPSEDFLKMIEDVRPDQVTLVPDPPEAITSNAGWRVAGNESLLKSTLERLTKAQCRISLFVDPYTISHDELAQLKAWGAHRIELYTEKFAEDCTTPEEFETISRYQECAREAHQLGLGINAGHDLNSTNLRVLYQAIPELLEVSIGHAFIADALYLGYQRTLELYKHQLRPVLIS